MKNTPNLHLHTWALADPVSVAEMNENFTAIDEANARQNATAQLHDSAIIRSAYRSVKNALRTYHGDDTAYDDCGVWLADFSKGASQAAEVWNLRLVDGCYVLPYAPQSSVSLTVSDDHVEAGESTLLAEFTTDGFGTIESITASPSSGSDHSTITYYIDSEEKSLGSTGIISIDKYSDNTFVLLNPIEVWPGMKLTLRAHASNAAYSTAHVYAGKSITLDITPCAHEDGWLQGKSFSVNGATQALIWLWWTGEAPTVELLQNAQQTLLTPVNQGATHFIDGTTAQCGYYRAMLAAVGDVSMRLHPQAGTRLCGGTALCI